MTISRKNYYLYFTDEEIVIQRGEANHPAGQVKPGTMWLPGVLCLPGWNGGGSLSGLSLNVHWAFLRSSGYLLDIIVAVSKMAIRTPSWQGYYICKCFCNLQGRQLGLRRQEMRPWSVTLVCSQSMQYLSLPLYPVSQVAHQSQVTQGCLGCQGWLGAQCSCSVPRRPGVDSGAVAAALRCHPTGSSSRNCLSCLLQDRRCGMLLP
jgi:hypothetical protein